MRPYRGRHERPTPPPSLDRAGNRARTAELVGRESYMSNYTPPREWVGYQEHDVKGLLPLDLMPMDEGPFCDATMADHPQGAHGYVCTRRTGHTGRHAASNGEVIVAVWEAPNG